MIGGPKTCATAIASVATDQYLMSKDVLTKHLLTTTTFYFGAMLPMRNNLHEQYPDYAVYIDAAIATLVGGVVYVSYDPLDCSKINKIPEDLMPVVRLFDTEKAFSMKRIQPLWDSFVASPREGSKLAIQLAHDAVRNPVIYTQAISTTLTFTKLYLSQLLIKNAGCSDVLTLIPVILKAQSEKPEEYHPYYTIFYAGAALLLNSTMALILQGITNHLNKRLSSQR